MENTVFDSIKRFLLAIFISGITLMFAACGGGGEDSNEVAETDSDTGKLMLSLTDAEGDFLSYSVDVTSIKLTRNNGQIVEVIPNSTTVDFAQYVELTEFFTAADIPNGAYNGVTMSLDYTNAQIVVEGVDGNPQSATIVDSEGNAVTEVSIDVEMGESGKLVIAPGVPSFLTIDFDLNSSHTINMGEAITAELEPVIIADAVIKEPKPHQVKGLLERVDVANMVFVLDIKPFRFRNGRFGDMTVNVDSETAFEIDGENHNAEQGLLELASQSNNTKVMVIGQVDKNLHKFVATHVYAGDSLPWGEKDIIKGHIVARDGNILSVRGARIIRSTGRVLFRKAIQIEVSEETLVNRVGDGDSYIDQISVGSVITAIGVMTIDDAEDNIEQENIYLDATNDVVRIHQTTMCGTVVSVTPFVLDLQAIGGRPVSIFDFSGTGFTSEDDADEENYEIDTGEMSLESVNIGDPVRVKGFVADFSTAPIDFEAGTVIDSSSVKAVLNIRWQEDGAADVFSEITSEKIILNTGTNYLSNAHHIVRSAIFTDIQVEGETINLIPADVVGEDMKGLYTIKTGNGILVYADFSEFAAELTHLLDEGKTVKQLSAVGAYDDVTTTFTLNGLIVVLKN
ncbi:MAG: DUF4382 domain-containing protein [Gammaproteobacteria bacterium]|nr:MAG: DUF4382 domain-containing protein [Gammaproteobacteria bacterium]